MLDKLQNLSPLSKLAKLDSSALKENPKNFNATLPVLLKVLAQTKGDMYLLRLGNTTIQTRSAFSLDIGKSYWANMQKNSAGQIVLSNLFAQPNFVDKLKNIPLKLSFSDLDTLSQNPKLFISEYKDFLLSQLANAQHKDEFKEISSLIFSLQQGVVSLVIGDEGKEHLVQIRPKGKKQSIDFYAIFPNIGAISGDIFHNQDTMCANFVVMNEKIKQILESYSDELGFDKINISCTHKPMALFEFSDSLLDIRG